MKNWQKVIYLNFGTVKTENIAKVLDTDVKTVLDNAEKLGVNLFDYDENWQKKGFVTVIRNNWDILSNSQIADLLEINETELNTLLEDYDFLKIKLGNKPLIQKTVYYPLTEEEQRETLKVKQFTIKHFVKPTVKPFNFFENYPLTPLVNVTENKRIFNSSYCARYSGALADDTLSDYPEEYLKRLQTSGTNGIWIYETLKNLAPFPFDENLQGNYQLYLKNLDKLTKRCKKYGIDVYLYLNEPRSLNSAFFEKYPELKGQKVSENEYCLCFSNPEVKLYFYNACKYLAKNVPLLKGVMTITMSENPTHCYSRIWNKKYNQTDCPICKNRKPYELAAEVNNVLAKALKDGNGKTILIANLWGWSDFMGWSDQDVYNGISLLDKDIEIMCVSEYSKTFERGGVKSKIIDYSISEVGPSEFTKKIFEFAKKQNRKIWAKIQINNSWECSAVPYLPTFDLMVEHVKNLLELGVEGFMTGWSLGGYPGGVSPLINSIINDKNFDEKLYYNACYGENAEIIKMASTLFSEAFSEFPFSIDSLYFGGQTLGAGNKISINKCDRPSTMVCFTFDDYENYTKPYGITIYLKQYKKLLEKWKIALDLISNQNGNSAFEEYKRMAEGAYYQFYSAYLTASFSLYKRRKQLKAMKETADKMKEITLKTYLLVSKDAKIGFEMTNHYYYNANLLLLRSYELDSINI